MTSTQTQTVGEKLLALPLGATVKSFLDYLTVEAGLSENTILGYARDLKGLLEFCQPERISRVEDIKPS
jgi:site-specific recombinase XerD